MNYELVAIISAWFSLAGFLWMIHRDIVSLSERMARLEGSVDVLKDLFRSSVTIKS